MSETEIAVPEQRSQLPDQQSAEPQRSSSTTTPTPLPDEFDEFDESHVIRGYD
ncbi:hypothetical protein [Saccharopolyspora rectivirgula]|uniref:hypothetical protein n=1 Tax=Saccharopolyspora rectivirgula TaxID=28042 RepID=UPI0013640DA1|nr:hypothetical protein [Saccharopolyspora rectivirgula]